MSIIGTGVPTNRTNIQLPNEVSAEILQKTQEGSMVISSQDRSPFPDAAHRSRSSQAIPKPHG